MNKNYEKLIILALCGSLQLASIEAFPWQSIQAKNNVLIQKYAKNANVFEELDNAINKNNFPKVAMLLACDRIERKFEQNKDRLNIMLHKAIKKKNILILSALLDARNSSCEPLFDVNQEQQGATPIMLAVQNNCDGKILNLLVQYGASMLKLATNSLQGSVLHSAIFNKRIAIARMLLQEITSMASRRLSESSILKIYYFFNETDWFAREAFTLACDTLQNGKISVDFFNEILSLLVVYYTIKRDYHIEVDRHGGIVEAERLRRLEEMREKLQNDMRFSHRLFRIYYGRNLNVKDNRIRGELLEKINQCLELQRQWEINGRAANPGA